MLTLKTQNGKIGIERHVNKESTSIHLYVDGKETILDQMETSEFHLLQFAYDKRYIVVFSGGYRNPTIVRVVYDMGKARTLTLDESTKDLFAHVYEAKESFTNAVILQYLNDNDLQIISASKVKAFENYITGGNSKISKEEVRALILKEYPRFKPFCNVQVPLSVLAYDAIIDDLGCRPICFNTMKEALEGREFD